MREQVVIVRGLRDDFSQLRSDFGLSEEGLALNLPKPASLFTFSTFALYKKENKSVLVAVFISVELK